MENLNLAFYTYFIGSDNNPAFLIPIIPSLKYKCYYYTNNKTIFERLKDTNWIRIFIDIETTDDIYESNMFGKHLKAMPHEYKEIKDYDKIVLSPGPGIPNEAGLLKEIISFYSDSKSILGVCLGHQAIAEVFGAELINLKSVYHGVATEIKVTKEDPIFRNLPSPLKVGRYHSWIVDQNIFPQELEITSIDTKNKIMSLRHKLFDIRGVQFHPESIMTKYGETMLKNWVTK